MSPVPTRNSYRSSGTFPHVQKAFYIGSLWAELKSVLVKIQFGIQKDSKIFQWQKNAKLLNIYTMTYDFVT